MPNLGNSDSWRLDEATRERIVDIVLEAMDEASEGKKGGWCKWEPIGAHGHAERIFAVLSNLANPVAGLMLDSGASDEPMFRLPDMDYELKEVPEATQASGAPSWHRCMSFRNHQSDAASLIELPESTANARVEKLEAQVARLNDLLNFAWSELFWVSEAPNRQGGDIDDEAMELAERARKACDLITRGGG